jgi:hypothetical protein
MNHLLNRPLVDQVLDAASSFDAQRGAHAEQVQQAMIDQRNATAQIEYAVASGVPRAIKRHVTTRDVQDFVKGASDADLLEAGASAKQVGDLRSAQSRLARRRDFQAAHGARAAAWMRFAEGARNLARRHSDAPADIQRPAVDRSVPLLDVRGEIAALEAQRAEQTQAGISRDEVEAQLVEQVEHAIATAGDDLADGLRRMQGGLAVNLLSGELAEAPVGDGAGQWAANEIERQTTLSRAFIAFAVGREGMLKAFRPLIDALPPGVPADQRAQRMADIDKRLVVLYRTEGALMLDDDGNLLPDVDPRPGQDVRHLVLVEAR